MTRKIQTLNSISKKGLARLPEGYTVANDIASPDAILVRSQAMHDLKFIGESASQQTQNVSAATQEQSAAMQEIASAGHELTKFAEKAGADAALVVGPYYNKPTQEGIFAHFKAIAESVEIPICVYGFGRISNTSGTASVPSSGKTSHRKFSETGWASMSSGSGCQSWASRL